MLSIDTTIDVKCLEIQLKEFGLIDITEYRIVNSFLLSVHLETEYINGIELFVIISNYEIIVERNNKENFYKVRTVSRHSLRDSILGGYLSNTIEIYE